MVGVFMERQAAREKGQDGTGYGGCIRQVYYDH